MKRYAVNFTAKNIYGKDIICTMYVDSHNLLLAVSSFEEKTKGNGYEIFSVCYIKEVKK